MNKLLFTFFLLLFSSLSSFAQNSLNMTLQSRVQFSQGLSDVWGWTDDQGNEYAIVAERDSIIIFDINNPAAPFRVASYFSLGGGNTTWRDMKTYEGYAYCVSDVNGGDGLKILNLNMLPGVPAVKDTNIQGMTMAHNIWIDEDNGYAYLCDPDVNPGEGMDIYDLSDPWKPTFVGRYDNTYVHDVYVRNDTAYSCELTNGLTIIDMTNKANPTVIGNRQYVNNFTHNSWLNDAGDVCFTTDEQNEGYIYAWDVSDPGNIVELDNIRSSQSNGLAIPHNTHVENDYLVTSYYADGVVIFDGSRPHNLVEVAYYDTDPGATGGGFPGCWGAYPFFPSGTVIATDQGRGLFIFQVNYERACYLEGTVTDSVSGTPLSGADVIINATGATDLSDNQGDYATGVVTAGSYTATYSKFGYVSKTVPVTLSNGVVTVQDVELVPLQSFTYSIEVIEAGSGNPISFAQVEAKEAGGTEISYLADFNGQIVDNQFYGGNYTFTAGQWGWRTKQVTVTPGPGNAQLTIELEPGYYDDFYFAFNWNVSGAASRGEWERGEPDGTSFFGSPFNPDEDVQGDFGDQAYVTGNGGGNAGDDDVDGGETVLESPSMNLTTYNDPVLKFHRWFANGGGGGGQINDYFDISVSNGFTTVSLSNLTGNTLNTWQQDTFLLSTFIPITGNMRVQFTVEDVSPGHLVEGAVDLFEITEGNPVNLAEAQALAGLELTVYPNPLGEQAGEVSYDLGELKSTGEINFELRDLSGKLIWTKKVSAHKGKFTLPQKLSKGMYTGSLKQENQTLGTFKIVK